MTVVTRDYGDTYKKFTSLGPLMTKVGNGGKGISWNTEDEVKQLGELNYTVTEAGISQGLPKIETAIDACETILMLAPETNGQVAVKAWAALSKIARTSGTVLPSLALVAALVIAWNSIRVGATWAPMMNTQAITPPTNKRPINEMPRC